jgi:uncharacterized protein (DUF924 family)
VTRDWRSDVLNSWFGLTYQDWWNGTPELDHQVREDFLKLWTEKRQLPADEFLGDPRTALAAVLLFDQFPRNMFRGDAEQFATDTLALSISKGAVDKGFDEQVSEEERPFFYTPFEHSEDLDEQNRGVLLYSALSDQRYVGYAKKHRDIIEKFGRFPHRNKMLGRAPRPDEVAAGDVFPW